VLGAQIPFWCLSLMAHAVKVHSTTPRLVLVPKLSYYYYSSAKTARGSF
jgi:hypothetical protein